jgi:preprotein translocase subunit SecB
MTVSNGSPELQPGASQMPAPQIGVLMQYVKDLSFENPNAPRALTPSSQQPSIKINIGVDAAPVAENNVEVTMRLDGKAEVEGLALFGFELLYAGVFRILNVPPESIQPIIMVECPRLLFPFVREIVATTTRNGGFPPLLLEPVDFAALYRGRMTQPAPPFNPS